MNERSSAATRQGAGWKLVYRFLWASFFLTAALNMLRVKAGFLTSYLADLTLPALLYVISRGLGSSHRPKTLKLMRWIGETPERAAACFFLASVATEVSQIFWPHGFFRGRFDVWDIVAYGTGIFICYVFDKRAQANVPVG